MTIRVLGVHGVGNHDTRATDADRSAIWTRAIQAGFADGPVPDLDVEVAYYAPALHRGTSQGPQAIEQLTPPQRDDLWAWLVASGLPEDLVVQGTATRPIRQAVEWFARRHDLDEPLVEWFITRFFPEVHTYFDPHRAGAREQARDIVGDAVDRHAPRVLLAHSLGSVLAYEALWQRASRRVELLVTLGSPLAMPSVVYDRLTPSPRHCPAGKPPAVTRWVNISDPGDLIAIPRPLSRYFTGIEATFEPVIAGVDFHLSRHYLASPALAALLTGLGQQ